MADYAIHDTTLTGISNVIRKKEGTSALIDPADYADRINLMGMLEEKTVSSSPIVTFADGADEVPIKKCEVSLSASLDGYSSVDVVATGKNLVDGTDFTQGLPSTTIGASIETISASTRYAYFGTPIKGGNYNISSVSNDSDYYNAILIFGYSGGFLTVYTGGTVNGNKTVDFSGCDYVRVAIGSRTAQIIVPTDFTDYGTIQFEAGSTATTYEPYTAPTTHTADLGRTIYGGSVDVVKGQGESTFAKGSIALSDFTVGATVGDYTAYTYTGYITESINNNNKQVAYIGTTQIPYIYQGIGANTTHFYIGTNGQINLYLPNDWSDFSHDVEAVAELATPETFTFDHVPIDSKLGNNTMWAVQGDTEVTYRSMGTVYQYPEGEGVSF